MTDKSVSIVLLADQYAQLKQLCEADHFLQLKQGRGTRRGIDKPLKGLGSTHACAAFAAYLPAALERTLKRLQSLQEQDRDQTAQLIETISELVGGDGDETQAE